MNEPENGHSQKKAFLAKRMSMENDDRFEVLWESLADREIIEDWERGATSAEDVVDDAKQLLSSFRAWEGHTSSRRQEPKGWARVEYPVEPSEREKDMTAAFREYLAVHAAQHPIVRRFRREYLPDGRLLTDDHDIALLLDEQKVGRGRAGTTDVQQYLDENSDTTHNYWPVRAELSGKPPTGDVTAFGPMGGVFVEFLRVLSDQERRMQEDWWGKGRKGQEDSSWPDFLDGDPTEENIAEKSGRQKGYEGYFGAQLETLGSWLAAKYPWKGVGDAVVFLISGRPPRLAETAEPLSATDYIGHATHSLTFSPWISEKTIVRAFRVLRGRSPGDKTVRVLRFVSGQADKRVAFPHGPLFSIGGTRQIQTRSTRIEAPSLRPTRGL